VVVAVAKLNLLVVGIDALAKGLRSAEVERRVVNLENLTRGDGGIVGGKIEVGVDFADLVLNSRRGVCRSCQ